MLGASQTTAAMPNRKEAGAVGPLLFLALLLFFFISTTPFADYGGAALIDPQVGNSNLVNQVVTLVLSAALIGYGITSRLGPGAMLQPRNVTVPLFVWFVAVSAISATPDVALRKVVLALLICTDASVFLLLPRSTRQFARLLMWGTLVMLAVAYLGVALVPGRAIHQATELIEPEHAGLWHGQFPHKNVAAAVMVLSCFIGLYIYGVGFRLGSLVILALSGVFLLHTGGKSAIAYLPVTLAIAHVFERWRWSRVPIAIGGPLLFNVMAIGCALSEEVSAFVRSIGIDPTFTARTDIWRLAVDAIGRHPILGYGFQGFWQTDDLFYSGGGTSTWAVKAYNGHNSWIDVTLTTGLPALVMVIVWLVILPLRDIARAEATGNDPALTRLFTRIWLYGLFSACLETVFFESGEPLWFMLLFAVFGLRLQAGARARQEEATETAEIRGGSPRQPSFGLQP